jgi:hypothetical protein
MWGFPVHHEWRKQIASGTLIGPRMVIGSPILDGPQPVLRRMTSMVTPEDAGREVARAKDGGAEFIKIYLKLPRQLFFAVAEESKRNSISFVGHVPASVSVLEATRAGQRSIEHDGVLLGASSREHDLARALARAFSSTPERQPNGADLRPYLRMAVDTFDRERVTRLSAELKRNHTSVCPTLTVFRPMWRVADEGFRADPRLKYLPRGLRDRFESFGKEPRSGDDVELWRRYYEIHSASVGHMRDAGVQLLAGTDGGEPYSFPAFGLHDELRLLVDAGLSPLAALQTATLNPARFFGREQDLGTIDEGKVADLVLLDASPLTAIGNTTKVNAVVANGRLFRRADLDELLAQAERAAKE